MNDDLLKGFEPEDVSKMNRSERRNRIKFYKKELTKHNAKKPLFEISVFDKLTQKEADNRQEILKAWLTRYGLLIRKIQELKIK